MWVIYSGPLQLGTIFLLGLFGIFIPPRQFASFFSFLPHAPEDLIPMLMEMVLLNVLPPAGASVAFPESQST